MSKPRYAYLGPEGTFTELALRDMVAGQDVEPVPVVDVMSALGAVRSGDAKYAVVAIENTVEGGVTATLDTLAAGTPLVILGETVLPVSFELAVRPGATFETVTRIAAHSHGLAQCRRWLNENVPDAVLVPASSNAASALLLADDSRTVDQIGFDAVLAPPGLAGRLGLEVLRTDVADNLEARTRFVRVGRPEAVPAPTGADKTTLVVHLAEDRAGALLEMLEQFAARGVNLSRIESRPRTDKPGEYSFSIDALGHVGEARMAEALMGLKRTCPMVIFLGSYPAFRTNGKTPVQQGTTDADFAAARAWVDGLREGQH